jgi:2-oxo-3-hexenedioate decarboxylase
VDVKALALELQQAREQRRPLAVPFSAREPDFGLATGYAVEAELRRGRLASGRRTVGLKAGYANKAVWRALKLDTLVWGHLYDDTVVHATGDAATLAVGRMCTPKIEPEIVFKLRLPIDLGDLAPAAVLGAVEWLALGFEIVDCPFPDWAFQPADFVAAYGFHAALVIGTPHPVDAATIPSLVERLTTFPLQLRKHGEIAAEGSGRNVLRSPALCLAELARAVATRPGEAPLAAGDLVSTGSLTEPQEVAPGDTWSAHAEGLGLPDLSLRATA